MGHVSNRLIEIGEAMGNLVQIKDICQTAPDIWDSMQEWLAENCYDLQESPVSLARRFVKDDDRFEFQQPIGKLRKTD
jgi:predicted secreted protein